MFLYYAVFLFVALFSVVDTCRAKQKFMALGLVLTMLVVFVTFRGGIGGDGMNYLRSWAITPTFWDKDWSKPDLLAYSEPMYYWFTFLLKSIWDNAVFYFGVVAALSAFFLYRSLRLYAMYPLMALAVYMSRFFILRDFNQIRAAVAISIIIYATRYIAERRGGKFFAFWLLALCFHTSMVIVLPFYWLNRIQLTRKQVYIITFAVFACSFVLNSIFEQLFERISVAFNILSAYTGDGDMATGRGMLNPMIYFQLGVLFLFTAAEDYLKDRQPYYYTIRNGYLYSTLLLMLFSSMLVIGARLSTVFATYEIFMLPALVSVLNRKSKIVGIIVLYLILLLLYGYNLTRAGGLEGYGNFEVWFRSAS